MRRALDLAILLAWASALAAAQTPDLPAERLLPYTIKVPVKEVSVPFHAADFRGVPITDLTLADIRLRDNGKPPRQVVSFQALHDLPVRIGFLIDASPSASWDLPRDDSIARDYLARFFDPQTDQGFVMRFDGNTELEQDWSASPAALVQGLQKVRHPASIRVGTAILDTIYRACLNQFSHQSAASANFIVLFSDGVDNLSHARIEDDVEECQASNTMVYAFSPAPHEKLRSSDGQKTLTELAGKTGGRVFYDTDPSDIHLDLQSMDANMRTQYRITFTPAELKPDGSFHRIKLDSPTRGGDIFARSGYYAPQPSSQP